MRRLDLVLLASLRLCAAQNRGFSIQADLLAYPQYEVIFAEQPIAEKAAQSLLEHHAAPLTYSATPGAATDDKASAEYDPKTYELMSMAHQTYLCSIPSVPPETAEDQAADELARAEEDRKRIRAAADGWNLLSDLEHTCLYFTAGWWTYSFCKNTEIVQYHALPAVKPNQPPQRDPRTAAFTLGREPAMPRPKREKGKEGKEEQEQHPAELLVLDDHSYLVQKLERGDVCDLTGRERTIEVRYECMPNAKGDRIGYIKEVAICAYLMVVHTPKLCKDVAFLPREEPTANAITCQLVVDDAEAAKVAEIEAAAPKAGAGSTRDVKEDPSGPGREPVAIGGTVVGGRKFLSAGDVDGQPPTRLGAPKDYFNGGHDELLRNPGEGGLVYQEPKLIAQRAPPADGGKLDPYPTEAEIEAMEIPYASFRELEIELDKMAESQNKGWRIEATRENGRIEIVGSLYPNEATGGKKPEDKQDYDGKLARELEELMKFKDEIDEALREWKQDREREKMDELWDKDQHEGEDTQQRTQKAKETKEEKEEGSEERFKDEL